VAVNSSPSQLVRVKVKVRVSVRVRIRARVRVRARVRAYGWVSLGDELTANRLRYDYFTILGHYCKKNSV